MAPTLRKTDDELRLSLSGTPRDQFSDALAKAKAIPGRVYDPEAKEWVYPLSAQTAMRIVQTIRVDPDPAVNDLIREAAASVAEELTTRIPDDDASLTLPWTEGLYPFQRAGVRWLIDHPHAILADDMGLGKTVQALSAVEARRGQGDALVVAPKTVLPVWRDELSRWAGVDATIIDGDKSKRVEQLDSATGWVLVNWEKLRLMPELAQREWQGVIADEAHRAKNRKALQTKALWRIRAPVQYALTGTPVLNQIDELWAILRWLDPDTYTSYWAFYTQYVESYEGHWGKVAVGVRNADALRFALRNTLARRTKRGALSSMGYKGKLPTQTIEVELHPYQRKLYQQAEDELWIEVEKSPIGDGTPTGDSILAAVKEGRLDRLSILVPNAAAAHTRMRQIISTPALIGGEDKSSKLDAAVELVTDHPEKQFVIFAHFQGTIEALADRINRGAKNPQEAVYLHGGVADDDRERAVRLFQAGDARVIVCSIMAGGQGITLTAADTAIFVERESTPGYNQQALDRLDRIGQENYVQAINLDAVDTIDTGRIGPANRIKELTTITLLGAEAV